MKKFLLICAALSISPLASANDAGVTLVQKMYQEARHSSGIDVVQKYADAGLRKALRSQNDDNLCIDSDPMWGNQDPDTDAKVNVRSAGKGKVRASFLQYGRRTNVTYTVNCSGSSCKISNVGRMKQALLQCR